MKLLQLSVAGNLIAAPAPTSMVNHGTIHNTDNSQNINNFVNINVTNNIHNISDTDFSQISLREIKSDINPYTHPSDFIPILMRLIYFNKDFPKNNNIKLINDFRVNKTVIPLQIEAILIKFNRTAFISSKNS